MIFAAVDIGSNAMRLLFCRAYDVNGKPHFSKEELIRLPIRLGEDVFTNGKISEKKAEKLITAMRGFRELIKVYEVDGYRAVATSAMRDASNSIEIIERIKKEAAILTGAVGMITETQQAEDILDKGQADLIIIESVGITVAIHFLMVMQADIQCDLVDPVAFQ